MGSKQLQSILNSVPAATVEGQKELSAKTEKINNILDLSTQVNPILEEEATARIVATIPLILKEEIRQYLRQKKGETEKMILLKGLKLLGFNIKPEWLLDQRTTR